MTGTNSDRRFASTARVSSLESLDLTYEERNSISLFSRSISDDRIADEIIRRRRAVEQHNVERRARMAQLAAERATEPDPFADDPWAPAV